MGMNTFNYELFLCHDEKRNAQMLTLKVHEVQKQIHTTFL